MLRYRSLWSGCIISFLIGAALYGANFVVPIFAQNIMHLTSQQTGVMMLSSAVASALGMAVVGTILPHVDPRKIVVFGVVGCALTTYALVGLSPETSREFFFWPLTLRGLCIVSIFLARQPGHLRAIPKKIWRKPPACSRLHDSSAAASALRRSRLCSTAESRCTATSW